MQKSLNSYFLTADICGSIVIQFLGNVGTKCTFLVVWVCLQPPVSDPLSYFAEVTGRKSKHSTIELTSQKFTEHAV